MAQGGFNSAHLCTKPFQMVSVERVVETKAMRSVIDLGQKSFPADCNETVGLHILRPTLAKTWEVIWLITLRITRNRDFVCSPNFSLPRLHHSEFVNLESSWSFPLMMDKQLQKPYQDNCRCRRRTGQSMTKPAGRGQRKKGLRETCNRGSSYTTSRKTRLARHADKNG